MSSKYCSLPFTSETPIDEFYIYSTCTDLSKNLKNSLNLVKFRTIGVFWSDNGFFYVKDIEQSPSEKENVNVLVSLENYTKSLPSLVMPLTVQMFGTAEWKGRPVLYPRVIQILNTSMALRLGNTMSAVIASHLATAPFPQDKEDKT